MSPIDTAGLDAQQVTLLKEHSERWARFRLSSGPSDRGSAEKAAAIAYISAGYPPPLHFEWGGGPIEIARRWAHGPRAAKAGMNLKAAIVDKVRHEVDFRIRRRVSAATITRIAISARTPVADAVGASIRQAVVRTADAIRPNLLTLLHRSLRGRSGLRNAMASFGTFSESSVNQHDLDWVWNYIFLREKFSLHDETAQLLGLKRLASVAGWFVPCERVCWLSERHDRLYYDGRGRLHCAHGPALSFPDGWSVYAWKGIVIPQALIEERGSITPKAIDGETDIHVRRCMIEILTPERYIAEGAAVAVATDDCGTLWQKRWANGDAWSAVEVVNGTANADGVAERYFLQVPNACRTPREAVAWTYGMSELQYARLAVRT